MKLNYEIDGTPQQDFCEPEEVSKRARDLATEHQTEVRVVSGGTDREVLRYFVSKNNGEVYVELVGETIT